MMYFRTFDLATILLLLAALAGAPEAWSSPFDHVLGNAECEGDRNKPDHIQLRLQSEVRPWDALGIEGGWERQVVLEFRRSSSETARIIWAMKDTVKPMSIPAPQLHSAISCFEFGGAEDLVAVALIFKPDLLEDWDEAWLIAVQLPVGSRESKILWEEYFPRLPLPRGVVAQDPWIRRIDDSKVLAVFRRASRSGPPLLLVDLERKIAMLHPRVRSLHDERVRSQRRSASMEGPPTGGADQEWFSCTSVRDCAVIADRCGGLHGVNRDFQDVLQRWQAAVVEPCSPSPLEETELRILRCLEERCTVELGAGSERGSLP